MDKNDGCYGNTEYNDGVDLGQVNRYALAEPVKNILTHDVFKFLLLLIERLDQKLILPVYGCINGIPVDTLRNTVIIAPKTYLEVVKNAHDYLVDHYKQDPKQEKIYGHAQILPLIG